MIVDRRALAVWAVGLAVGVSACATAGDVEEGSKAIERTLSSFGEVGRRCAPKPLALSRAELVFAQHASERGHAIHAARHLERADAWRAAFEDEVKRGCPGGVEAARDDDQDGVPNGQDKCPLAREDIDGDRDADGCPDVDTDGDGVDDTVDRCINEREDLDGYLDHDGCPELDNDGDGIGDDVDQCPLDPEDVDGFEDIDGCPERNDP